MEQPDKQPENFGSSNPQPADALLRSMTQDIENLRQNLVVQLSQDVERLQREKSRLIEDIEKLQAQRQQQAIQQQKLVQQIAPALANQLQELLSQQLNQLIDPSRVANKDAASTEGNLDGAGLSHSSTASDFNQNTHRLIASLDSTLRTTFRTLQQDLSSYQSSLSQQLGQMYSLEQQGEAILETLVSRLRETIQSEPSAIQNTPLAPAATPTHHPSPLRRDTNGYPQDNDNPIGVSSPPEQSVPTVPLRREPEPPAIIPPPQPKPQSASNAKLGFILVLLYSLVLSFQNIVIRVILKKSSIFGMFKLGGFIAPSVGNSLLILWMRMLVVIPLMAILATILYPSLWRDIKQFIQSKDWPLFFNVLGSGFFLFLSQVLIYLALGPISAGVAITIFFIYPIITVLLAWARFGDRPSLFRSIIIAIVLLGVFLISIPSSGAANLSGYGVSAALGSGITFALYVILTQASAKKLHPIPFSWVNFVVIFAFSSLSLSILPEVFPININYSMWPSLIISCLVLGGTTLVGYLLNNIGISMIGAARASIIGATGPALTALLAAVIIQETLRTQQLFGMVLVTLGVAGLSFERLRSQSKVAKSKSAARKSK
ncbi:MAG TPA: DMT family transporter [Coleofasciculaceae cyanobacterium]|jgi:drug/metabolite transporter (DMT)-like permease